METVPIPKHPLSSIDDDTIQQIETAILEDRCVTERQQDREIKTSVGSEGKNICDNLQRKNACLMDFTVAHTFTESRTGEVR